MLGAAISASAHDLYPIHPVRATLRVEPDRVVADLQADSVVWIEEVTGLHPMPARDWPASTLSKVESYANDHFRLDVDGVPLRGRLIDARYRQFPWEVNEEGAFFLRLVYPPLAAGSRLAGTARFYEEYRHEIEEEYAGRPLPYRDGYQTVVTIPGEKRIICSLTPETPAFSVSSDESRRSPAAMSLESVRIGMESTLASASGFPTLLAIALCLGAARPRRTAVAALFASAALGFTCGRTLDAPAWLVWSATLGSAVTAGRRRLAPAAGAAACGCLGFVWHEAAHPLLPHFSFAQPFALTGAMSVGAALLSVAWFGMRSEYRRMADVSESRVDELFARRVRLGGTILAMIGAYGLWQSFQR
jgi:hypothetical protein